MDSGGHCTRHNPHRHWLHSTLLGHSLRVKAIRWQGHRKGKTTPPSLRRQLRRPLRLHPPHPNGPRRPLLRPPPQNPGGHVLHLAVIGDPLPHPHRKAHENTPRGC